MTLSNRWVFNFIIIWSIPWCYAAAVTGSRAVFSFLGMQTEQYSSMVGLIMIITPIVVLTNFKFNSFGRYTTITLLVLYSIFSISHVINMVNTGYYGKAGKFPLTPFVSVINLFVIYYYIGKPYKQRLEDFRQKKQNGQFL